MTDGINDNVVNFPKRMEVKFVSVPDLCEVAGKILEDVVILGGASDGSIKMLTSKEDVSDILFYLETAKFALMSEDLEYPEE